VKRQTEHHQTEILGFECKKMNLRLRSNNTLEKPDGRSLLLFRTNKAQFKVNEETDQVEPILEYNLENVTDLIGNQEEGSTKLSEIISFINATTETNLVTNDDRSIEVSQTLDHITSTNASEAPSEVQAKTETPVVSTTNANLLSSQDLEETSKESKTVEVITQKQDSLIDEKLVNDSVISQKPFQPIIFSSETSTSTTIDLENQPAQPHVNEEKESDQKSENENSSVSQEQSDIAFSTKNNEDTPNVPTEQSLSITSQPLDTSTLKVVKDDEELKLDLIRNELIKSTETPQTVKNENVESNLSSSKETTILDIASERYSKSQDGELSTEALRNDLISSEIKTQSSPETSLLSYNRTDNQSSSIQVQEKEALGQDNDTSSNEMNFLDNPGSFGNIFAGFQPIGKENSSSAQSDDDGNESFEQGLVRSLSDLLKKFFTKNSVTSSQPQEIIPETSVPILNIVSTERIGVTYPDLEKEIVTITSNKPTNDLDFTAESSTTAIEIEPDDVSTLNERQKRSLTDNPNPQGLEGKKRKVV